LALLPHKEGGSHSDNSFVFLFRDPLTGGSDFP
jgi:hypothetical protein